MNNNLENLITRTACLKWKPLTAYLKINETKAKYFNKHKEELYQTKTNEQIKQWYQQQQNTIYRLFRLYTIK
jgi:hypothetical protein